MIKFVAVLVLSVVLVQGRPNSGFFNDDLVQAAAAGNWDKVQKLLSSSIPTNGSWEPLPVANVKNLKPIPGGHVYGESQYTFHSETNVNGETSEKSGGHKIVNDDGRISEFDFKPVKPAIKP
ncbi:uncharacterized protein LOC115441707 [Manduca sexta]|uniref:Uncharacterized protein n=1 Tax=Manduca sexta TaxID=7130 RepID=A0A922CIJ3_MANSE|nr:uncharacterized protein LOC115441707 [Manduca sexta]KAG6447427.1 hypothetical protein O3G_MSEX004923 [Manduca sexta]